MYNNNTNNSIPNTENVVACFDMSGLSRIDEKYRNLYNEILRPAGTSIEEIDALIEDNKEILEELKEYKKESIKLFKEFEAVGIISSEELKSLLEECVTDSEELKSLLEECVTDSEEDI